MKLEKGDYRIYNLASGVKGIAVATQVNFGTYVSDDDIENCFSFNNDNFSDNREEFFPLEKMTKYNALCERFGGDWRYFEDSTGTTRIVRVNGDAVFLYEEWGIEINHPSENNYNSAKGILRKIDQPQIDIYKLLSKWCDCEEFAIF